MERFKGNSPEYDYLYENVPTMMHSIDKHGFIVKVNRKWLNTLGYMRDEVIGRKSIDFLTPESKEKAIKEILPEFMKTGQCENVRYDFITKSGRLINVLLTATSEYDEKGEISNSLAVLKDISELIKTKTELKQTLSLAKLGSWEFDLSSGYFLFNDNFYEIFQSSVELIGGYKMSAEEYATKFIHPEDRDIVEIEINKAVETTDPNFSNYLEHRIRFENNEIGYIGVTYFIEKDLEGNTIKLHGFNQDITNRIYEQVEKEKRTLAVKKLEETETLLKEIHHRIKNNLQIISSLLNLQINNTTNNQTIQTFTEVKNRVSAISLVHEKLYSSSNFKCIELSDYIMDLCQILTETLAHHNTIKLSFELEKINVNIDKSVSVGLILNEAITNAIKYAFVQHKSPEIIIKLSVDKENANIQIRDNGNSEVDIAKLQESNSLGVNIMKSLTKQLNGEIDFFNDKGLNVSIRIAKRTLSV